MEIFGTYFEDTKNKLDLMVLNLPHIKPFLPITKSPFIL